MNYANLKCHNKVYKVSELACLTYLTTFEFVTCRFQWQPETLTKSKMLDSDEPIRRNHDLPRGPRMIYSRGSGTIQKNLNDFRTTVTEPGKERYYVGIESF
jgi:hypothetical protein